MHDTIDCVLPVREADFERFDLLRMSVEKFFQFDGTVWVVVPDKDAANASKRVGNSKRFQVISESQILPELSDSTATGWRKQQAIKLAFYAFTRSSFYLTLDADCVAVRPIEFADLVQQSRGLTQFESFAIHEDWYASSSIVLDMPFPTGEGISPTPFLFASELVNSLCAHLTQTQGHWSNVFLNESTRCTEYTLYHIFASHSQTWDRWHWTSSDPQPLNMFGNCVWDEHDLQNWQAEDSFRNPSFLFSVLQSNTVSVEWARSQVSSFFA